MQVGGSSSRSEERDTGMIPLMQKIVIVNGTRQGPLPHMKNPWLIVYTLAARTTHLWLQRCTN